VVLKPAPDTPWCATTLGRLVAEETDIPPGVVNVVAGSDHALGEMLANAPSTVKRVLLELGGKSATIMLDDADLPSTLASIGQVCTHGGQGCALTTRLLLPRSRYEEGVALARQAFETFPYGDPNDPSHLQGPQISARQRERVLGYIARAKQEGARL